jgi:hypothetical protein
MKKKLESRFTEYDFKVHPTYTLVVYEKIDSKPDLFNSFDGRRNSTDTAPKTFDDPKYWTPLNGFNHLVKHFNDKWAHKNVHSAFIRKMAFGSPKEAVWNGSDFVQPSAIVAKPKPNPSVKTDDNYFIYRLGVPLLDGTWQNFYSTVGIDKTTGAIDENAALNDVTAKFRKWSEQNNGVYKSIGWVYGGNGVYNRSNPPQGRSAYWFDCVAFIPKYHQTNRIALKMLSENY